MARTKGGRGTEVGAPSRQQDQTSLADAIADIINATIIAPLEERVEVLEQTVAGLSRGTPHTATLELRPKGRRSGTVSFEPEEGFETSAIGQPVIMVQGPTAEDEFGIVVFTAAIVSERLMRVAWFSPEAAPERVAIVYLIG